MKRKARHVFSLFVFFFSFLLTSVGSSSWNISGKANKEFNFHANSREPVAYYNDSKNKKHEFGTIAGALTSASAIANSNSPVDVIVYPNTTGNVAISQCTIANYVTLYINYEDSKNYTGDQDGGSFGDTSGSKSKIKLIGTRSISTHGKLIIGGKTGQNGTSMQGGTFGDCAELNIDGNGSINCDGTIECYGFIHDLKEGKRGENEAAIVLTENATVSEPLVMYTWFGGNAARNIYKTVFPCNVFDLPNIRAPRLFSYGAKLKGSAKVNAQNSYRTATASLIKKYDESDSNGFLQLKENGTAFFDANDSDLSKTNASYQTHRTTIQTNGDFVFSGVSVSVGVSIDTRKNYLPISGIFNIKIGEGNGSIQYKTKLLPGASLTILSKATLTFEQDFVAYAKGVANNGNTFFGGYRFTSPAEIYNEGTRKIKSGFDGEIFADLLSGSSSLTVLESGYSGNTDCKELDSTSVVKGFLHNNTFNYSTFSFVKGANRKMLTQRISLSGSSSYFSKEKENGVANRTYVSNVTSDGQYGWTYNNEYRSYPIVIDYNGNDAAVDSNWQKYIENYGSGTTLSNLTSKDPDQTFAGFYYDQACTKALKIENNSYIVEPSVAVGYVNNGILTIYSKWITAGLITINQYKGQNDLTTTQNSLTSGKTYHLSDFNITDNDSRLMKKVDRVSRTEFVFQNWIIYDVSDANKSNKLSSDGSFTPESGKSYNLEPVFRTNYYLYRSVAQNWWKSWGTKYYRMHNFKVSGSDTPQDVSEKNKMFSATLAKDSKTSTTYTSGWISLNATISFDRESRTSGGPNYVHISIGSNEKMQVSGNENNWDQSSNLKSCTIALSQYFNDDFVNGNEPISITADNNKSSNVQTI